MSRAGRFVLLVQLCLHSIDLQLWLGDGLPPPTPTASVSPYADACTSRRRSACRTSGRAFLPLTNYPHMDGCRVPYVRLTWRDRACLPSTGPSPDSFPCGSSVCGVFHRSGVMGNHSGSNPFSPGVHWVDPPRSIPGEDFRRCFRGRVARPNGYAPGRTREADRVGATVDPTCGVGCAFSNQPHLTWESHVRKEASMQQAPTALRSQQLPLVRFDAHGSQMGGQPHGRPHRRHASAASLRTDVDRLPHR